MAPAANADSRHGGSSEARGVQIAAERAAKQGIDWADCPADWGIAKPIQCGWVTVPLDYARAERQADQARRRPDRQHGHQGGAPGRPRSTTPAAPAVPVCASRPGSRARTRSGPTRPRRTTSWASTRAASATPRPISCIDPQEFVKAPKADPVPDSEADKRAQRKLAAEYADGCAERSGWMLPHMTTPNTARDLDVIRAALGEKKLNFLGVSYGTYLGAVYGDAVPEPRPPHGRRQRGQPVAGEDLVRGQPRPGRRLPDALERLEGRGSPRTTPPSTSGTPRRRSSSSG